MLIDTFVGEARELLENATQHLLQLEREPDNVMLLEEIFRAAHTLKGSAGIVGLAPIQEVAHALEDLLDRLRSGTLDCSPELIDVLLAGFDVIDLLVEAAGKNDAEIPFPLEEVITRIKQFSSEGSRFSAEEPRFSSEESSATVSGVDSPILRELDRERLALLPPGIYREILFHLESGTKVYQIVVEPAGDVFYSGLDPLRMWREAVEMGTLLHFETAEDAVPPLQEFDPEYCYLSFAGYLTGDVSQSTLEEAFAFLASETSRVRVHEVTWLDLVCAYESRSEAPWEIPLPDDLLQGVLDALRAIKDVALIADGESEPAAWQGLALSFEDLKPWLVRENDWHLFHRERLLLSFEKLKRCLAVLAAAIPENVPPYKLVMNFYLLCSLLIHRFRSVQPGTGIAGLLTDVLAVFDAHATALQAGTYPDLDLPGIVRDLLEWTPSPIVADSIALKEPTAGSNPPTTALLSSDSISLDEPTGTVFLGLLAQQKEFLDCRRGLSSFSDDAQAICHLLEQSARHLDWPWLRDRVRNLEQDLTDGTLTAEAVTGFLDEITARVEVEDSSQTVRPQAAEKVKPPTGESRSQKQDMLPASILPAESRQRVITETVKVEQRQVDRLMNLAGELVVAKNSLPFLAREIESAGLPLLARQLKDNYLLFERLVKELQDTVMDIRMLPVAYVFEKFPRFVRDTARALGKRVTLLIEGEETRLDKGVIEGLNDPLVHLVRNALDHGLEPEAERLRLGKRPEGVLVLRAASQGDRVVIEVGDDGRGIDPDLIRATAVRRGLLSETEAAALSDEAALQLIFKPGFSTADEVTELSGRGVGMDVVATSVQRLKGRVYIHSRVGEGTTVQLELPLTMATSKVLLLTSGRYLYGLPLEAIRETMRVPRRNITTLKGHEVFLWRGKLLPLLRLNEMLGSNRSAPEATSVAEEEYIVVLMKGAGLVVSDVVGEQEIIIKPLTGELAKIRTFLGAAILGDGNILLVLDPASLVPEGV